MRARDRVRVRVRVRVLERSACPDLTFAVISLTWRCMGDMVEIYGRLPRLDLRRDLAHLEM